jgi:hypothetical protein
MMLIDDQPNIEVTLQFVQAQALSDMRGKRLPRIVRQRRRQSILRTSFQS